MDFYKRVSAVIIQNKKILFVKCNDFPEYFTPGGKRNYGETDEETLKRELKEELGLELIDTEFLNEYKIKSQLTKNTTDISTTYLVKVKGKPKAQMEIINFVWISKKDLDNKAYQFLKVYKKHLIPDLIKNKLFWLNT